MYNKLITKNGAGAFLQNNVLRMNWSIMEDFE